MKDAADLDLRRVVVTGSSCSGKTTFARRLAELRGAPHVELDALHWLPGWREREREDFRARVRAAAAGEEWVFDGSYAKHRELFWPRATCFVWLNPGYARVLSRALRRTVRRAASGEELFSGNRESFRQSFLSRDSILLWVLHSYHPRRRLLHGLFAAGEQGERPVLELRTPAAVERFVQRAGSLQRPERV